MAKIKLENGESEYKNGYRYRYTDADKKQHAIYGKTLPELRAKRKELLEAQLKQEAERLGETTLEEQIENYLDMKINIKPSSQHNYNLWFQSIRKDSLFKYPIHDIRSSDIKKWLIGKRREGYSQSTINGYFTALIRPAFQMAIEDEILTRNPADFRLKDVIRIQPKKKRALTDEEQKLLVRYLREDERKCFQSMKNILIVMMETGLRPSELCALTKNDIDIPNRELTVDKQVIRLPEMYIDTPKSESGFRKVYLTDTAIECLKEAMLDPADPSYVLSGYRGFIFHNRKREALNYDLIRIRYKLLMKIIDRENGTDLQSTTPHCLRHTYCTNLLNAGVNVKTIQYLMGHKHVDVTMDIYAHSNRANIQAELQTKLPR